MTKLFTALLGTETNSFSPFVTGTQNFESTYFARNGEHGEKPAPFAVPLVIWRERAKALGWEVVESLAAFATPAGITKRDVYEGYRDEILADLKDALPVDAVIYNMHGAMIAEGYDDCEGDLIARTREIVGPDVPIGAELDLHCHITALMVEHATAIITYKEYPHVDFGERAEELFTLVADTVAGTIKPHITLLNCNLIGVFHTTREPMISYVAGMQELEQQPGVLSVSLGHGFPWGDIPDMGTRLLVVTDNRPDLGRSVAAELKADLDQIREAAQPPYLTIAEALDQALAFGSENGPVILADVSDNSGGGAANDSTFVLEAMLARGIQNGAVSPIWDPIAVQLAMEAGVGATFAMRIGGKMGPMSGNPLDLTVTVTGLAHGAHQRFGPGRARFGDAAALHANGIDIVVNSLRTQTFSPEAFSCVGVDPTQKSILVVKSMQHFYAAFEPIAGKVLYVAAPGTMYPNLAEVPYTRVDRSMWPLSA